MEKLDAPGLWGRFPTGRGIPWPVGNRPHTYVLYMAAKGLGERRAEVDAARGTRHQRACPDGRGGVGRVRLAAVRRTARFCEPPLNGRHWPGLEGPRQRCQRILLLPRQTAE